MNWDHNVWKECAEVAEAKVKELEEKWQYWYGIHNAWQERAFTAEERVRELEAKLERAREALHVILQADALKPHAYEADPPPAIYDMVKAALADVAPLDAMHARMKELVGDARVDPTEPIVGEVDLGQNERNARDMSAHNEARLTLQEDAAQFSSSVLVQWADGEEPELDEEPGPGVCTHGVAFDKHCQECARWTWTRPPAPVPMVRTYGPDDRMLREQPANVGVAYELAQENTFMEFDAPPAPSAEPRSPYPVVAAVQDVLTTAGFPPSVPHDIEIGVAARVCDLRDSVERRVQQAHAAAAELWSRKEAELRDELTAPCNGLGCKRCAWCVAQAREEALEEAANAAVRAAAGFGFPRDSAECRALCDAAAAIRALRGGKP